MYSSTSPFDGKSVIFFMSLTILWDKNYQFGYWNWWWNRKKFKCL